MIALTDAQIMHWAAATAIPWTLVAAVVEVESKRNPWAVRFEPQFTYLHGSIRTPTEVAMQKSSYGVMQVMGATARELGFNRPYLTELCDPEIGLEYGCRYLAKQYERHKSWKKAIAAYNAGSPRYKPDGTFINQDYVDRVLAAGTRLGWDGI